MSNSPEDRPTNLRKACTFEAFNISGERLRELSANVGFSLDNQINQSREMEDSNPTLYAYIDVRGELAQQRFFQRARDYTSYSEDQKSQKKDLIVEHFYTGAFMTFALLQEAAREANVLIPEVDFPGDAYNPDNISGGYLDTVLEESQRAFLVREQMPRLFFDGVLALLEKRTRKSEPEVFDLVTMARSAGRSTIFNNEAFAASYFLAGSAEVVLPIEAAAQRLAKQMATVTQVGELEYLFKQPSWGEDSPKPLK